MNSPQSCSCAEAHPDMMKMSAIFKRDTKNTKKFGYSVGQVSNLPSFASRRLYVRLSDG